MLRMPAMALLACLVVGGARSAGAQNVRPAPGHWAGVVSNGYKGDSILFTVPAGATRLSDIYFRGYWRCSGAIEQSRVGPPDDVPVTEGAFSNTQTRPSWWWKLEGRFTAAATAEGTYRQAANGATCDTRVLKWTARRIGN